MYQKGLRYYRKKTAGAGVKWHIQALVLELKHAWQRAWNGYSDADVWDISGLILDTLPVVLSEYREYHHALFIDEITGKSLSKEETDAVIDELIFYLKNCNEEVVYERLFGINPYAENDINRARWRQVANERKRCKNEAFALLSKWIWQLWD